MSFTVSRLAAGRASPIGYAQLLLPSSLNHCRPLALVVYHQRTSVGLRYGRKVLPNEIFLENETICVARTLRLGLLFASQLNGVTDLPVTPISKLKPRRIEVQTRPPLSFLCVLNDTSL